MTDGNERPLFSYSRGNETSRKPEDSSADGLDYNTMLRLGSKELQVLNVPHIRSDPFSVEN